MSTMSNKQATKNDVSTGGGGYIGGNVIVRRDFVGRDWVGRIADSVHHQFVCESHEGRESAQ